MNDRIVKCRNCGAVIEIEDKVTSFNCPGCNCYIVADESSGAEKADGAPQYGEGNVTEGRTEDIKTETEAANKRPGAGRNVVAIVAVAVASLAVIVVILMFMFGGPSNAIMPFSAREVKGWNYEEAVASFQQAGFRNIKFEVTEDRPWSDLLHTISDGEVKEVVIQNGDDEIDNFDKDEEYPGNAVVIIRYYSFDEK